MGSNPVAPTIIQNRWLSRQYELESQRFFSCLDVSLSLLFVNLKNCARHTWATIAADIDIPDAVIDRTLGHKSPYPMTNIYVKRNQKEVDEAVRAVIDYINSDR